MEQRKQVPVACLDPGDRIANPAPRDWAPATYTVKRCFYRPRRNVWQLDVEGQVREDRATLYLDAQATVTRITWE